MVPRKWFSCHHEMGHAVMTGTGKTTSVLKWVRQREDEARADRALEAYIADTIITSTSWVVVWFHKDPVADYGHHDARHTSGHRTIETAATAGADSVSRASVEAVQLDSSQTDQPGAGSGDDGGGDDGGDGDSDPDPDRGSHAAETWEWWKVSVAVAAIVTFLAEINWLMYFPRSRELVLLLTGCFAVSLLVVLLANPVHRYFRFAGACLSALIGGHYLGGKHLVVPLPPWYSDQPFVLSVPEMCDGATEWLGLGMLASLAAHFWANHLEPFLVSQVIPLLKDRR